MLVLEQQWWIPRGQREDRASSSWTLWYSRQNSILSCRYRPFVSFPSTARSNFLKYIEAQDTRDTQDNQQDVSVPCRSSSYHHAILPTPLPTFLHPHAPSKPSSYISPAPLHLTFPTRCLYEEGPQPSRSSFFHRTFSRVSRQGPCLCTRTLGSMARMSSMDSSWREAHAYASTSLICKPVCWELFPGLTIACSFNLCKQAPWRAAIYISWCQAWSAGHREKCTREEQFSLSGWGVGDISFASLLIKCCWDKSVRTGKKRGFRNGHSFCRELEVWRHCVDVWLSGDVNKQ